MASQRKAIKAAIREKLIAANVTDDITADRVFVGRALTLDSTINVPGIMIYMLRDEAQMETMEKPERFQMRQMDLVVDYWIKAGCDLENAMDDGAELIEACINENVNNVGARDIVLTATEYVYDGKEDEFNGCARLVFRVIYSKQI